jgi:peroxiredoxin
MNRKNALWLPLSGLALLLVFSGSLAAASLKVGYQAGNMKFAKTITETDRNYLGLQNSGPFTLNDIKAEYVLIEALNANCPHCMEQAAGMNRLYRLVEDSELKGRLKFIGVFCNAEAAVNGWRKAHKVPFALLSDPGGKIAGDLNITGTPTTVIVNQKGTVLILHDGVFRDAQQVFKQLKAKLK